MTYRRGCDTQGKEKLFTLCRNFRKIGMLGKEIGYEISTCHMQYDANNKETDKKDPCSIYSGGNDPRKRRKY